MDRIWRVVEASPRAALEQELSPTDLQSLLLTVARTRASRVTAARVARRWQEDRFVRPAVQDPRRLIKIEAGLWAMLPDAFVGVELSPVVPLGTCCAVATVDQNRVVSTVRGTEVLSDPTNALAVEAAWRRAHGARRSRVDMAACHRVLRAQTFDGPGLSAHFKLFALVSTARDAGSARRPRLVFTVFDAPVLAERFNDVIRPALAAEPSGVELVADPARTQGAGYYQQAAIGLRARDEGCEVDLGDGGITTWTATLLGDAKERCVVSCAATERLAALSC
jgi:hypothetical protein